MQKMLLSLVFALYGLGFGTGRKCLPIWSELFDAKSRENQLD